MGARVARGWLAAAVLLFGATDGSAQDPPPPKVPLAFALEPGRVVRFVEAYEKVTVDQDLDDMSRRAGLRLPERKVTVRTEFSVEVLKVLPDGKRSATIRFGRITATVPGLVGPPVEVASDRPLPKDSWITMQASEYLAPGGLSFPAVLDARGSVLELTVPDTARATREKVLRLSREDGALFFLYLSPKGIAARVNRAWGTAPLPEKAVDAGDSWEARVPSALVHPCGQLIENRVLRVEAVSAGEVRVEGKGTVTFEARDMPKEIADVIGTLVIKESSVASSVRILTSDGLPHAGRSESTVVYQEVKKVATRGGAKTVRTTSSLERVDTWPSEPGVPSTGKKK